MALASKSGTSYDRDVDPELQGDVDFDFFSASEHDDRSRKASSGLKAGSEDDRLGQKSGEASGAASTPQGRYSQASTFTSVSQAQSEKDKTRSRSSSSSRSNTSSSSRSSPRSGSATPVEDSDRFRYPVKDPQSPASSKSHSDSASSRSGSRSRTPSPDKPRDNLPSRSKSSSNGSRSPRSPSPSGKPAGVRNVKERSPRSSRSSSRSSEIENIDIKKSSSSSSSSGSTPDDVTDVSPLSSPTNSPFVTPSSRRVPKQKKGPEEKTFAGPGMHKDRISYRSPRQDKPLTETEQVQVEEVMKAILAIDRERRQTRRVKPGWRDPTSKSSPSPDQAMNVQRENERLMRRLIAGRQMQSASITRRPYHSTVNRQRQQRKIEVENTDILKRIRQINPTPGMTRLDHLSFYQQQCEYGVYPAVVPKLRRPRLTASPLDPIPGHTCVATNKKRRRRPQPPSFSMAKAFPSSRGDWVSGW